MRDIGLHVMAQNEADLLTDNLQSLREDLTYSNDETATDLVSRLRYGLERVGALLSSAHQARSVIVPKEHVLSTFLLPGTMLPGNSISDAVDSHVAQMLAEEKRDLTILHNVKVGELLSIAHERAFVSPGSMDNGQHVGETEWERLMLTTAEELSNLSQQIALSATSAELVKQELKRCRREERANRWQEVQNGGVLHSTPPQPHAAPNLGSCTMLHHAALGCTRLHNESKHKNLPPN
jgi:hypothetical protein